MSHIVLRRGYGGKYFDLLTYLLTYSMEQSPSWEANSKLCSQSRNFPHLWNSKFPHRRENILTWRINFIIKFYLSCKPVFAKYRMSSLRKTQLTEPTNPCLITTLTISILQGVFIFSRGCSSQRGRNRRYTATDSSDLSAMLRTALPKSAIGWSNQRGKIESDEICSMWVEMCNAYTLFGKQEGKSLTGKPRRSWKDCVR
jgi:hypothetical protein